jgi:uncharacterized membrane protein
MKEAGMGFVDESVLVAADVKVVYSLWLDYEQYPRFMRTVEEVSVIGYCRLRWTGRVCDRTEQWEADVLEHVEDTRVRWQARDGRETGEVTFEKGEAGSTWVHYQLEYEQAPWGVEEEALRSCLRRRVRGDLEDFKVLAESRRSY